VNRAALVVALVVLPLLTSAVVDLVLLAREQGHVPLEAEYLTVRDAVLKDGFALSTDVIAVLPAWSLRPHVALKEIPMITGDLLWEQPFDRFRRVYILTERDGEDALERVRAASQPMTRVMETRAIALWRVDVGGPFVTTDFSRDLARADVRIVDAEDSVLTTCAEPVRGGFRCSGRKPWQRVTRERALVTENGDDVVWAHAPPKGEIVEVRYTDVTLGDSVVLRAGHTRTGADKARAPVDIEVRFENVTLFQRSVSPLFHFATDRIDTRAQKGTRGMLTLRIRTVDESSQHFAFDGFVSSIEGGR
jgi:hypothetical protein